MTSGWSVSGTDKVLNKNIRFCTDFGHVLGPGQDLFQISLRLSLPIFGAAEGSL